MWIIRTIIAIRDATQAQAQLLEALVDEQVGITDVLLRIQSEQTTQGTQLIGLLERTRIMATQDDVDRITAAIDTATTGIRADIEQLKADAAAGNDLNFSGLDAKVAALSALDAENPAAPA